MENRPFLKFCASWCFLAVRSILISSNEKAAFFQDEPFNTIMGIHDFLKLLTQSHNDQQTLLVLRFWEEQYCIWCCWSSDVLWSNARGILPTRGLSGALKEFVRKITYLRSICQWNMFVAFDGRDSEANMAREHATRRHAARQAAASASAHVAFRSLLL